MTKVAGTVYSEKEANRGGEREKERVSGLSLTSGNVAANFRSVIYIGI